MGSEARTIADVVRQAKERIAREKITLKELAENIPMDESLLAILLNQDNEVVDGLSLLVDFMGIKITGTRENKFTTHRFVESGDQIKVIRVMHPKCSMIFDTVSRKMFDFRTKYKRDKISEHHKQLIINEMAEKVEIYALKRKFIR